MGVSLVGENISSEENSKVLLFFFMQGFFVYFQDYINLENCYYSNKETAIRQNWKTIS